MKAMNRYVECFGGNRVLASAGLPALATRAGTAGRSGDLIALAVGRRELIGEPDAEPPPP